jgi:TonB family protein
MSSTRSIPHLVVIASVVILMVLPPRLEAQTQRDIARMALQTAKKIAKTDLHIILTTPLSGCLGAPDLCTELDMVLHADLEKLISGSKFIQREEALKHLADHGFLSIDAYMGALDVVASDAGAEVVVGEDFQRRRDGCRLHTTIVDAKHLYALADFSTGIPCSVVQTKTTPSLVKDPVTGVSMIISIPASQDAPQNISPIHYPSCVSCPDPHYSGYARQHRIQGSVRVLITVTVQGMVENARAVGSVEEGLARVSLQAVSGWQLKPAVGSDGKPFPARVPVEVTFRLIP